MSRPGLHGARGRCDLDHDILWPHGPTAVGCLTNKHRQHHSLHTHGHWRVCRESDGIVRWRPYLTRPKDWLEVVHDSYTSGDSCAPGDPPSHNDDTAVSR